MASNNIPHWIAGKAVVTNTPARGGEVCNPATGAVSAQVPFATAQEINTAVSAARGAFKPGRLPQH